MLTILAQDSTNGGGGSGLLFLLPLVLIFWFLLIRPQRQRMKHHQQMVQAVQVGDEIETVAGVFGTIRDMTDEFLWVEIAPGTTIKMSRAAVRRRLVEDEPSAPSAGELPPDDQPPTDDRPPGD